MKLDLVHDIQNSYRKVLNCMSRPGYIENIQTAGNKADIDIDFYKPTLVVMLMLLDAEASFRIFSKKETEITQFINQLTYANASETEEADFIFVMSDAEPLEVETAFRSAKSGSLIDPHKSATIIIEAEGLSGDKALIMKGPGIKEENYAGITARGNWIEEREKKNLEYPLGVDVIFIDRLSNIMCIPRTTQIFKA